MSAILVSLPRFASGCAIVLGCFSLETGTRLFVADDDLGARKGLGLFWWQTRVCPFRRASRKTLPGSHALLIRSPCLECFLLRLALLPAGPAELADQAPIEEPSAPGPVTPSVERSLRPETVAVE